METKIKQYVDYQFRFDNREDIDDLKAEITANLIDRYYEYLNSGKSPNEAYVEAIKSIGDFSENPLNEVANEYSIKPSIPDILLLSSTILSIFGLLIFFFSGVVGTIITVISIVLYSASSYYLYSYSQYVRKEDKDIEKHHLLLTKIFKYLKTNFIFWAVNLSFILASLTLRLINTMTVLDPKVVLFSGLKEIIIVYICLYIIFLIIFLLFFRHIYKRLINHYYLLTGNKHLKGKIKETCEFLFSEEFKLRNIIFNPKFISIIILLIIIIQLFIKIKVEKYTVIKFPSVFGNKEEYTLEYYYSKMYILYLLENLKTDYFALSFVPFCAIIYNLVIIILTLFDKLKRKTWLLFGGFYLWYIATGVFYILLYSNEIEVNDGVLNYTVIMMVLFTIYLIIRYINIKRRQKDAISR